MVPLLECLVPTTGCRSSDRCCAPNLGMTEWIIPVVQPSSSPIWLVTGAAYNCIVMCNTALYCNYIS